MSENAYRLLKAAQADNPATSHGDLIAAALVEAKATLLAERPTPARRSAAPPGPHPAARRRRPHPIRPFNVTPARADAIRALADEVGIPNLSELVDRSVVLTYDRVSADVERIINGKE